MGSFVYFLSFIMILFPFDTKEIENKAVTLGEDLRWTPLSRQFFLGFKIGCFLPPFG